MEEATLMEYEEMSKAVFEEDKKKAMDCPCFMKCRYTDGFSCKLLDTCMAASKGLSVEY